MNEAIMTYSDLASLVKHLRSLNKKHILLFAYNSTGKTRLSFEFKEAGKVYDDDHNVISRDTLYFNAFTEDLFLWDNDLDDDTNRRLLINKNSAFISGMRALDMDNKIRPLLHRYSNFNFIIDYEYKNKEGKELWAVNFIREELINGTLQNVEYVKISRSEENLFIWCFFLAIAQLAIDRHENYNWVKYIYIDDPVSSLDDNNVIAIAHHLAMLLKSENANENGEIKTIISTHHALFFNVLCNEFNRGAKYFLCKIAEGYALKDTTDSPFLYHVSLIQELKKAIDTGKLYTYHFNILRTILEKAANFHGFNGFSDCLEVDEDDDERTLHARMVNVLNHGSYSLYDPKEMLEENKKYFIQIFNNYMKNYKFNKKLLENINETI